MDSKNQMSMWLSGCRGYSKKKSVRCWSHLQKSEQMKKWKDTKYKIQEDKKVENKMIIGIDHGNRNMKNSKYRIFSSNPALAGKARQSGTYSGISEPVLLCGWESTGKRVCG